MEISKETAMQRLEDYKKLLNDYLDSRAMIMEARDIYTTVTKQHYTLTDELLSIEHTIGRIRQYVDFYTKEVEKHECN